MASHSVTSSDFPYLLIRIAVRGWETEAVALLDTGFTGELVVPEDAIPQDVGTPDYISTYRVADDQIASSPMFYGDVEVLGLPRIPEVSIGALG